MHVSNEVKYRIKRGPEPIRNFVAQERVGTEWKHVGSGLSYYGALNKLKIYHSEQELINNEYTPK